MKKADKKKRITELTPDALAQLDPDTLISVIMKLYEQNKQLSEQMQAMLNEKYGKKTEKHENPDQLRLSVQTDATTAETNTSATETKTASSKAPKTKKPGHTRNPMPSHLRRLPIDREPTERERICSCGSHRKHVNQVVRNRRFECVPVSVFVEEIIDHVWQCPACGDSVVVEAEVLEPIKNGTAGPRLLVQIVEDRWLNHLPLYRQEQRFARLGIDINRSTMCGWMTSLSLMLRPIYDCMKALLLNSKIIATDDTPVKVQDRKKKAHIKRGHEWIFMGDNQHPVNLFHYTQGRGRAGPRDFIPGFKGYLLGDCFSGNRALCAETGATFVACRAHDRRYYKKARLNNKQLCDEMLSMYQELFDVEQAARDLCLSADQIVLMRQQESVPILKRMKCWLDKHVLTALPASSFGKAITYSLNNWEALNAFLLDGDLRIDNNLAEQMMKMFATGRKNWYFFGSDEAGLQASIMLSLLATCVRNNIEPGKYLYDVIVRLTQNPQCDPAELMPHVWKSQTNTAEITDVNDTPKVLSEVC